MVGSVFFYSEQIIRLIVLVTLVNDLFILP